MKKSILFAALIASTLTTLAQEEVSKSVSLGIPKDLKKVHSLSIDKNALRKAQHSLVLLSDEDGSQLYETDGIVISISVQKLKIDQFFFQGEQLEAKRLAALNYFSFITTEVRKLNGYQIFLKNKEYKDDPIGYIIGYGVPPAYDKLLVYTVQYNKSDRLKAFKLLDAILKSSKYKK